MVFFILPAPSPPPEWGKKGPDRPTEVQKVTPLPPRRPDREVPYADQEQPSPGRAVTRRKGTAGTYYVRTQKGKVSGPFSSAELKRMAREQRLDLSWQVSLDRVNWCTAAKVKNLFADVETAFAENLNTGKQYRSLNPQEVLALFLDKFFLNNENLKDSFPFVQQLRVWWAKLTLPKDFTITEVTATGVRHVKYNLTTGEAHEIDQREAEESVSQGVHRFNWFLPLVTLLGMIWMVWAVKDFIINFSPTWGTFKTLFLLALGLAGFIYKTKRSKVFVGYTLDPAAEQRLEEIAEAISTLRACSRVWMYRVQMNEGRQHWKYNAGDTFTVSRLPVAIFNRAIPNVETNVRVNGIAYRSKAVYFLPEKILVIDGGEVKNVPYQELKIEVDDLEYVESEGQVYRDSEVIDQRWKFINRDGTRDRRFKDNYELPVVRCGILVLVTSDTEMDMMTTNPNAPRELKRRLERLKTTSPT
jgi:hypothetical protein